MNFALWGISIVPAWLVIGHFGAMSSQLDEYEASGAGEVTSESFLPGAHEKPLDAMD